MAVRLYVIIMHIENNVKPLSKIMFKCPSSHYGEKNNAISYSFISIYEKLIRIVILKIERYELKKWII